MSKNKEEVSMDDSFVKIWNLRAMKSKLDLSTVLYLFYVFGILALGVFFITLA